ncbi:hypothetical protein OC25_24545 [Pedobacter kyungheensis]|uniref:Uncharacterized protein n=1 Tax=Pedobacter kyungheensis TaxID=1069985 RepID=A0A0C1FAY3_9SPHI|nr:hypothetical protein OC25_24545 [Pedobacter kyungheensis]
MEVAYHQIKPAYFYLKQVEGTLPLTPRPADTPLREGNGNKKTFQLALKGFIYDYAFSFGLSAFSLLCQNFSY